MYEPKTAFWSDVLALATLAVICGLGVWWALWGLR